jgi:hypothetical protein
MPRGKPFESVDARCPRTGKRPGIPRAWEREADDDEDAPAARERIYAAVVADLGGEDALSTVRRVMVRRFAFLACFARQLEDRLSQPGLTVEREEKLCGRLTLVTNALRSAANVVGFDRKTPVEDLYRTVG